MGFAGNLRTLALPEVLQTLNRIKATGVLRLASADGGRDVIFNDGELMGVGFRKGEERQALLRRLVLEGRLDATTVAQISSAGRESQVVARLVDDGVVDESAVRDAVQRQAEEELTSLFTWDYADFVFHDAGPEEPDVTDQVERAIATGVTFNLNSLLMESARRQDDWERLRQAIPDSGVVFGPREGQEEQLKDAGKEYPGSAVVPLVDAVRSVDDVVRDSVATRLDVYEVLAQLLERNFVVTLTRDDIIYHGDYLAGKNDNLRAASLYRRALAVRPADQATAAKLAECLARLGDAPEAAACHAQLAIGTLGNGDATQAVAHARKAVQLAAKDPAIRQTLVRCLLAQDAKRNTAEAVEQLVELVEIFLSQDRLEDARSTCLKVLELDKSNEPARRHLARIFSAAARDEQSEDVVVCIQCGEVNHREASECVKCKASLKLTCLACNRVVGVSDRMCIFCGADPHRGDGRRRSSGSPTTSRIVKPDKGRGAAVGVQVVATLDDLVETARAKEAAEDWEGALMAWREVAKVQVDNADLTGHIREIEKIVHDRFVEARIEEGHQMRRVRRYWAAIKAYKTALRTMASDDPRSQRLVEILHNTEKVGQRIALIYVAAILLIGVFAWLVTKPYLVERRMLGEITELSGRLEGLRGAANGAPLEAIRTEVDSLCDRVEDLGQGDRWRVVRRERDGLKGSFRLIWQHVAVSELAQIDTAIDQGDLNRADAALSAFQARYQDNSPSFDERRKRLAAEKQKRKELKARIEDAPNLFARAQATETAGQLGDALSAFRTLAESPNADIAAKSKEAVARLAPKAELANGIVEKAVREARDLVATDLMKAESTLAAVVEAATPWGQADRIQEERGKITAAMAAAKQAFMRLGASASIAELTAFLEAHPGSPEAPAVLHRREALELSKAQREASQTRFRQLLADKQWEAAYQAGRDLVQGYGVQAGDVRLPLYVESLPVGASVRLDGQLVGQTPCPVLYPPNARGELVIEAPGWQKSSRRLEEVTASWRFSLALERAQLWPRVELGRPVGALMALPNGEVVATVGDGLALVSARGQVRWRVALGGDDLGSSNKPRLSEAPTLMPDGRMLIGLPSKDAVLIDARGGASRYQTAGEVRGRPLSYVNEVLGATPRMAFAAEAIFSGEPGGQLTRIPLPALAISGPVSVPKDIDRALVVADTRGRLVAIEESTKKLIWEQDLQAADIGQLVQIAEGEIVCVLDGSRIACYHLDAKGATLRWTHQLESPAIGEPAVAGGTVHVSCGKAVVRVAVDGTVQPSLALSAAASSPAHALGDRVAVGCTDGSLMVFRAGERLWSTPTGSPPTAVAVVRDAVVAGTAAGTLAAFAP